MQSELSAETLGKLIEFDRQGFLPEDSDTPESFSERVRQTLSCRDAFLKQLQESGELTVFDGITVRADCRIPEEFVSEAGAITEKLYAFTAHHVPGFFLSKDVGLLWGGCMISDTEELLALFLIRSAFRNRRRWLIYRRDELLSHELCHSMRQSLRDPGIEEFFAYQTSPSALRRYIGNCFITSWDAVFFVLSALLLLAAQIMQTFFFAALPTWPFWILALTYPLFLLVRNQRSRNTIFKAEKKLQSFQIANPRAILFRATYKEIKEIGNLFCINCFRSWIGEKAQSSLRWAITRERFFKE